MQSFAGFPNILQPSGIVRDDGKRPDAMTIIPWGHEKSFLWDFMRFKHNHYGRFKENYLFTPAAFETLGCMGPETKKFIDKLGSLMKATSGESRSADYLVQKISIAIHRDNSACILGTLGRSRVDDFYLL